MCIRGIPGSPGVAEGVIRVYDGEDPDGFDSDDIVAIENTLDPKLAQDLDHVAALLLRTGGRLSHGVTIARELGITVVCGLEDAFNRLEPGASAEVDGTNGTIEIKEKG